MKKSSRVLWFSVSRNVLFCQENKNSNVDNFFPELDKNPPMFSLILRTLLSFISKRYIMTKYFPKTWRGQIPWSILNLLCSGVPE